MQNIVVKNIYILPVIICYNYENIWENYCKVASMVKITAYICMLLHLFLFQHKNSSNLPFEKRTSICLKNMKISFGILF